jgi:hypothetical protein
MQKIIGILLMISLISCEKTDPISVLNPEVFVSSAYLVKTTNKILVNCESVNQSSVLKAEYGICWSTTGLPTILDTHERSGSNSTNEGPYIGYILNVVVNTKYNIRAYIKQENEYIYSENYVYDPNPNLGWQRHIDIPTNGDDNLPEMYDTGGSLAIDMKVPGYEEIREYIYYPSNNYFENDPRTYDYVHEKFKCQIEFAGNKRDFLAGGGYIVNNFGNRTKTYQKKVISQYYNGVVSDFPGELGPSVGFGAGIYGMVLSKTAQPTLWGLNIETLVWQQFENPKITNFTNLIAAGTGDYGFVMALNELKSNENPVGYVFNQSTKKWNTAPTFPGEKRTQPIIFGLKNKIYFGLGVSAISRKGLKDLWEYDIKNQQWKQINNYPGTGSTDLAVASFGNSIFIGLGYAALGTNIGSTKYFKAYDLWEFNP